MMGRAKTAIQYGLLAMIFFISGISALRCHSFSSVIQNGSQVAIPTEVSIAEKIIICTNGQNACVEAQVTLSIAQTFLLVTHRGCANNKLDGAGFNSSGDPHFTVTSNVSYCFRDLCNWKMSGDVPWSPAEDTELKESGSTQCYSGLMLDPKESLGRVTCRNGYTQCYHGHINIKAGPLFMSVLIKTCRRSLCIAPKSQFFGPIEICQWGSCCNGSFCNGTETAPKIQNTTGEHSKVRVCQVSSFAKLDSEKGKEGIVPPSAVRATLPGHPVKPIMTSPTPIYEINYYDYFEEGPDLWVPVSEAVRFQSCQFPPLLIALGTATFGAWW